MTLSNAEGLHELLWRGLFYLVYRFASFVESAHSVPWGGNPCA